MDRPDSVDHDKSSSGGDGDRGGASRGTTKRRMIHRRYYRPVHWWRPRPQQQSPPGNSNSTTNTSELLPSFVDLQNKTHMTLYNRQCPPYPCVSMAGSSNSSKGRNRNTLTQPDDKSPKGSVDVHIQHVVDLINQHSHYCTLSSCSGRLSIFDPSGTSVGSSSLPPYEDRGSGGGRENITSSQAIDTDISGENSGSCGGKGIGRWVLVSHDLVDPQEAVDLFSSTSIAKAETDETATHSSLSPLPTPRYQQQPWILKFEPMLIHVAAASLRHGQLLLRIALDLGYRESGLVVTDKRVTVAIRCHSLALAVPIFFDSTHEERGRRVLLSDDYLRLLVEECNHRLQLNWDKMDRLYESLATHLFDLRDDCIRLYPQTNEEETTKSPATIAAKTISSIHLWNASAIVDRKVGAKDKNDSKECIWVMGGYGKGPGGTVVSNENTGIETTMSSSTSCKRSKELYCLTRKIHHMDLNQSYQYGPWDTTWRKCHIEGSNTTDGDDGEILTLSNGGGSLKVDQWMTACPDLHGMTSCQFQPSGVLIFWGGRQSPVRPSSSSTMYVLDTQNPQQPRLAKVDIKSQHYESTSSAPVSRWGHSLIAISADRAVLIGGCNDEDGALDDIWILHLLNDQNLECSGTCSFQWERLHTTLPSPRFHFGSTLLNNDTIMVLGGLNDTKEILGPFEQNFSDNEYKEDVVAIRIDRTEVADGRTPTGVKQRKPLTKSHTMNVRLNNRQYSGHNKTLSPRFGFGMSCCTLMSKHLVVVTGGISFTQEEEDENEHPIETYWVTFTSRKNEIELERIPVVLSTNKACGKLDFGSLVHHSCLVVGDEHSDDLSYDSVNNSNRCHEIVLIGGGVSSFAFGESFAKSHHLCFDVDNILSSGSDVDLQIGSQGGISSGQHLLQQQQQQQHQQLSQQVDSDNNHKPKANVIYVHPSDAKRVKNLLESSNLLDKRFRMMKIDHHHHHHHQGNDDGGRGSGGKDSQNQQSRIALPIIIKMIDLISRDDDIQLKDYVVGHGVEELPWSSSQIASMKNNNNNHNRRR